MDRDQKLQCLWATAADMLDVLKDDSDGRALDELSGSIVSDMMKQIYDCAMFVREYGGKGFLSQFRNTFCELESD
jgi:hypothetical protein